MSNYFWLFMLPVEHHVFLRKVRFLLRFKNSDNLICSLFLDNASIKLISMQEVYSANVNNKIHVLHLEHDGTVYFYLIMFS